MPLPAFTPSPHTSTLRGATLTRSQAASRLGLHPSGVDKLVRAGVLAVPIQAALVETLAGLPRLAVEHGELTVLRTDARADAYPGEDRRWIGFHVEHTDVELDATSLRWWRCDPARILDNELFAVTVSTFPTAVYRITEHLEEKRRDGEDTPRHHFAGQLLARVYPGMTATYQQNTPGHLRELAKQVMASRVVVASGGPIGYLD